VAEKGMVPRNAIIDTGQVDGLMTIDLQKVEQYLTHPPAEESGQENNK